MPDPKPDTFPIVQSDLDNLTASFKNVTAAVLRIAQALKDLNRPEATPIADLCNTVAEEFEAVSRVWKRVREEAPKRRSSREKQRRVA